MEPGTPESTKGWTSGASSAGFDVYKGQGKAAKGRARKANRQAKGGQAKDHRPETEGTNAPKVQNVQSRRIWLKFASST